jgi:hypothetical protein
MTNKQTSHTEKTDRKQKSLSRRQFLAGLSALGVGTLITGCQVGQNEYNRANILDNVMASPEPPAGPEEGTPTPSLEGEELALSQFMALSAVLTGFPRERLNPTLGRVYLQSLRQATPDLSLTPADLFAEAGLDISQPLPDVTRLEQAGIFEDEAIRKLSDKIIEYWYTGVYSQAEDKSAVATTADALTWKALTYLPPPTICGPYSGFWAERPEVGMVPPVHITNFAEEQ